MSTGRAILFIVAIEWYSSCLLGASGERLADALPAVERFLSGRTFQGDEGLVQKFGTLATSNVSGRVDVVVTFPDGRSINIVDSFIEVDGRAVLVEENPAYGLITKFNLRVTKNGALEVTPHASALVGFIPRVCRSERQGVICVKKVRLSNGDIKVIKYRERH